MNDLIITFSSSYHKHHSEGSVHPDHKNPVYHLALVVCSHAGSFSFIHLDFEVFAGDISVSTPGPGLFARKQKSVF